MWSLAVRKARLQNLNSGSTRDKKRIRGSLTKAQVSNTLNTSGIHKLKRSKTGQYSRHISPLISRVPSALLLCIPTLSALAVGSIHSPAPRHSMAAAFGLLWFLRMIWSQEVNYALVTKKKTNYFFSYYKRRATTTTTIPTTATQLPLLLPSESE